MTLPRVRPFLVLVPAVLLIAGCGAGGGGGGDNDAKAEADSTVTVPAALVVQPAGSSTTEVAVLAGGCFWGVEGVFEHVAGVTDVVSGYAGGSAADAAYAQVANGWTKHAESVRITFDPQKITYDQLLRIYFAVAHDPTELDMQGPDHGPQYRSTIFPADAEQERVAQAYIDQLDDDDVFGAPVVTTIETGRTFYPAEELHQNFMERYPDNEYIVVNDAPKVAALEKTFPTLYRS